ncbi:hypothetical protein [Bacillus salipaludis]|uniref:Uncharacterized protein n=1 Tax=Bacillus salipaludis TaxID=2547811 RepID=A0AA90QNB6_9BACI|nr:hypothetical protein [Bacillus salipaludis]MDQ6596635.1 hypothetical protein [Bacillus salipaludis]MED1471603.1 hypothetical protein [Bacillus salipaludis]
MQDSIRTVMPASVIHLLTNSLPSRNSFVKDNQVTPIEGTEIAVNLFILFEIL